MKTLPLSRIALGFALALGLTAQTAVVTQPSRALSGDASSTIAATNTFQSIWDATAVDTPRRGCLIINNSTDRQWVFFGPLASATKATAIPLEPASATNALGGSVNCATAGGSILQDQVSITGTQNDTFIAKLQ